MHHVTTGTLGGGSIVNNAALVPSRPDDEVRRRRHYAYLTTPVPRESLQLTSSLSDEDWHRYWGVNVHGVFYCTREALRLMEPRREGKIINIASIAGISGYSAHSPLYSINGTSSFVQFEMDTLPGLGILESNPGPETTAYGLLADLINALRGG